MPNPILYISSTYLDLQEHRRALIENLQSTGCFDVIGMENYGTSSQRPLTKCLEDVDRAEYYILLLGARYGFIPEESAEGYSITHLEYKKAIGDENMSVVAASPNTRRIVLPFLMDENMPLPEAVQKMVAKEPPRSRELLKALKDRIGIDFVLAKNPFTTPDDLAAKVTSALITALVRDDRASLVEKLHLPQSIAFRCNREAVRDDFLIRNFFCREFYRIYVIHGERRELPVIFSMNLEQYELNTRENPSIFNIESYIRNNRDNFLRTMALVFYKGIFGRMPEVMDYDFVQLGKALLTRESFSDCVIKFDLDYTHWKKYRRYLEIFFSHLQDANQQLQSEKNFYLLVNVQYSAPKEKMRDPGTPLMLLNKLSDLRRSDIEQWFRTFFFMNKANDPAKQRQVELLATRLTVKYFPELTGPEQGLSMEDTIRRLMQIVDHFNENKELFANYANLFTEI